MAACDRLRGRRLGHSTGLLCVDVLRRLSQVDPIEEHGEGVLGPFIPIPRPHCSIALMARAAIVRPNSRRISWPFMATCRYS